MKYLLFLLFFLQTTTLLSLDSNYNLLEENIGLFTKVAPYITSTDTSLGEIIVCDNEPFVIDSEAYFDTGSFEVTIDGSQSGCDSTISFSILNITPVAIIDGILEVNCTNEFIDLNASSSIVDANAESTYLWNKNGLFYDDTELISANSGSYTLTVVSTIGDVVCANTTAFEVPISPLFTPVLNEETDTLCSQDCTTLSVQQEAEIYTYLWDNDETTIDIIVCPEFTTTYFVSVTDNNGCEQIDNTTVNVNPLGSFDALNAEICIGDTLDISAYLEYEIVLSNPELGVINGNNLTGLNVGTIDIILFDQDGCLQPNTNLFVTIIECCVSKDTTIIAEICEGDSIFGYGATGMYVDTFLIEDMCDSIVFLDLTMFAVFQDSVQLEICFGETYNGVDETSMVIDTFQSVEGCDSIVYVDLTVSPIILDSVSVDICFGESYNGTDETATTIDTFQSVEGCDSIIYTSISVGALISDTINIDICDGEEYLGYTMNGIYLDTMLASNGCDSILFLNLSIIPIVNSNIAVTICEGEEYEGYTETGIYQNTIISALGCDSIITVNLDVLGVDKDTIDVTICEGVSFLGYTEAGQYVDTTFSQEGCTELRILNIDVIDSIFIDLDTLICLGDTLLGTVIFDEGTYTFESQGEEGCTVTTFATVLFKEEGCSVGLNEFSKDWRVKTYPNPTNEILNIDSDIPFQLSLYDIDGSLIFYNSSQHQSIMIDISYLESGIYFLKLKSKSQNIFKKIVKMN